MAALLPPPGFENVAFHDALAHAALSLGEYLPKLAPPYNICHNEGFAGLLEHSLAYAPLGHDLTRENLELFRENAALKAQMALMQQNAALTLANAHLEKQFQEPKAKHEVDQSDGSTLGERLSRKERRQQFMINARSTRKKNAKCKVIAPPETWSDTARMPGATSVLKSVTRMNDVDETTISDESEVQRKPCRQNSHTVAMMQNIPLELTREEVLELIDEQGFHGSYALFYLPAAFQSQLNHGYAFIHFTSVDSYENFRKTFSGFSDWKLPSDRICEVSFSEKFSNIEDRIEGYRNSPIMHKSVEDRFKPLLFENGQRIPFPGPNKKVKAPRIRVSVPKAA